VVCSAPVRGKWLVVILGPSLLLVGGSIAALLLLPHPVPKTATGAQRVYLTHCASCHGADGRGSWRATLFLMRPGNLADPAALVPLTDDYLFALIKHGGGSLGKPGMPAFGYHLSDEQIRALVVYLRTFPERAPSR
jgi:mono/diheme cytochrome c family protein